ncbi:MAG: hypothetical protein ACYCW6_18715 [Candidatus Xenobia bacterium]
MEIMQRSEVPMTVHVELMWRLAEAEAEVRQLERERNALLFERYYSPARVEAIDVAAREIPLDETAEERLAEQRDLHELQRQALEHTVCALSRMLEDERRVRYDLEARQRSLMEDMDKRRRTWWRFWDRS